MAIDIEKMLRDIANGEPLPQMSDDSRVWASFTYDHVLPALPKRGDLKQLAIFLGHIFSTYGLKADHIAETMAMVAYVTPILDKLAEDLAKKVQ